MKKILILSIFAFVSIYAKNLVAGTFIVKSVTLKKEKKMLNLALKKHLIDSKNGIYTILLEKPINKKGKLSIILKNSNNKEFKVKIDSKNIIKDKITFKLYSKSSGSRDQDKYVAEVSHF